MPDDFENLQRRQKLTLKDDEKTVYRFIGYEGMGEHLILQNDKEPTDSIYAFTVEFTDCDKLL